MGDDDVAESRRREQWLAASNAVAAGMLAGEEQATTLLRIVQQARLAADASFAVICCPAADDDAMLRCEAVDADADVTSLTGLMVPIDGTVTGQAFRSGGSVTVRDGSIRAISSDAVPAVPLPPVVVELDSTVAVPLSTTGEPLGALTLARPEGAPPFTDADVQLIENFAHHAALVIEFSHAQEDLHRLTLLEDRYRIARDLHDIVIQRLYVTGLRLYSLSEKIEDPDVSAGARQIVAEVDDAIQSIRASIFALEEPEPIRGTPRAQLWHLIQEFADVLGFKPWVDFVGPLDAAVPDSVRADLQATVHEALSNVARHASATAVYVRVVVDDHGRELTLTVIDNGGGVPDRPSHGSGLANLKARAARWAGSCEMHAEPGYGAKLIWQIMLPRKPSDRATADQL